MGIAQEKMTTHDSNRLSNAEITTSLRTVPKWVPRDHSIVREFTFKSFQQAVDFVNRVAKVAEAANHHPDIFLSYTLVRLELSTHSAEGLSQKDFEVATELDRLTEDQG